jgi:hypothetical protein
VHRKHIAPCSMKPGQHEDIGADSDVADAFGHVRPNTSHASGAPSNPCFGAVLRSTRGDSTYPIGLIS